MRLFFHKLTHWEYWPFFPIYFPVILQWIYFSVRARSIFFFNAANPTIKNGGFMAESKKAIYDLIPPQFYPKTELITEKMPLADAVSVFEKSGIKFPLICKPDIGLRGSAVKKIETLDDFAAYHAKADFDFLIQDLIPYENEFGIFYVRYPGDEKGRITGIVGKEFLVVTGDGVSSIETLLAKNPRFALQLSTLRKEYGNKLSEVLPDGEKRNLVPYGNHARGAKFIDESHRITQKLTDTIDAICRQVPQFYFGRLDVMYRSFEALERGENFQIVELNGAASEPTHIYDPEHSIFFAWKELLRHNRYLYEISRTNKKNGASYLPHREGMAQYRIHLSHSKKIVAF